MTEQKDSKNIDDFKPEDLPFYTELPVGEILRRSREYYKKTIPEISSVLRIRNSQVEAIESGDIDDLPGRVYAIGFVRSYAEYLGLDSDQVVELFKIQHVGRRKRPDYIFPISADESSRPGKVILIVSIVLIVVMLIFAAPNAIKINPDIEITPPADQQQSDIDINRIPVVPSSLIKDIKLPDRVAPKKDKKRYEDPQFSESQLSDKEKAEQSMIPSLDRILPHSKLSRIPKTRPIKDERTAAATSLSQPQSGPALADNRSHIRGLENSWMEIRDLGGKKIFSRVLKKGEIYTLPKKKGLILSISNAGGIEISQGNRVLPPIGKKAEIKRNVSLDGILKP